MKKLFLSYRRNDVPGYVARLEDELERAFGPDRVFRDVEDIAGGAEWKRVLDDNLARSAALVLIIGPRWAEIWRARSADPVNYVAFELQRARELGVPVVPVTLNHTVLPRDLDLGEVSWLRDRQFYDISDVQNRWANDIKGLVDTLAALPDVGQPIDHAPAAAAPTGNGRKMMPGVAIAAIVVALAGFALLRSPGTPEIVEPAAKPDNTVTDPLTKPLPDVADVAGSARASSSGGAQATDIPEIAGTWVSVKDGTTYFVEQRADGSFNVNSPGYGRGEGRFIPNMPRKFRIEMYGIGHGEFSVSNSDDKVIGWLLNHDTNVKEYDTLTRVE